MLSKVEPKRLMMCVIPRVELLRWYLDNTLACTAANQHEGVLRVVRTEVVNSEAGISRRNTQPLLSPTSFEVSTSSEGSGCHRQVPAPKGVPRT